MQEMTAGEIIKTTGGVLLSGDEKTQIKDITTDSRKAFSGMLFVPLKGNRFDGHDFIDKAFESGAAAAITHKDVIDKSNRTVIKVDDTLKALGDIARLYRSKFKIFTAAITGSVGKTTTKDMLAAVLSQKYNTLKTQGNFNNEIGLPLTVLKLEKMHEAAVLEMGMSGFGEIHNLASIAKPDTAVITNIGMSHIEKLGSQEGILKAKLEITDFFDESNTLVVNLDDPYLSSIKGKYKIVSFGIHNPVCHVRACDIVDLGADGVRFSIIADGELHTVHIKAAGTHNVYNALAAVCVGRLYDVPMDKIVCGLESFVPPNMRMSIETYGDITVINDCYNASPASMNSSLAVLANLKSSRKIAVLGDMLEMGEFAPKAHYEVGKKAYELGIQCVIAAGENARQIAKGAIDSGMAQDNVMFFDNTQGAADFVASFLQNGDAVLIKASRGMHFENVYEEIKKRKNS
ncbi:MAG: UDP-N-acetylmuramoyl-tripeptide--D-alanyl-D-alanine ligase [Clostridia bacterium]|nr:UDP-N-acetylmuramoyl-tripeptide--D-alanyl-D-alanine ligase [Clostridia bacterium]